MHKHKSKKGNGEKSVLKTGHYKDKNLTLMEDGFGVVTDRRGNSHNIRRFTWKNHNGIEVQVINYGARIVAMKLPNRKGFVEDVILGFDDVAGYLYYENYYIGGTIGRVADKIQNATFAANNKQHWLSKNEDPHHSNGGFWGFDKMVWTPYVDGKKVLFHYVSYDKEEGFPGDLLVRITFELTTKNEFRVTMEANSTKPTIVNLSNKLFFNMAGHWRGPEELYKHILTVNANCFTPYKNNGIPTGEIKNVIHTKFDFQVPKIMKTLVGIEPDDGIDQNLCVNRGTDQGNCFVARLIHPPSGRTLEIYSNQPGLNIYTANDLGEGLVRESSPTVSKKSVNSQSSDNAFELIDRLHSHVVSKLALDDQDDYQEIRNLIKKLHARKNSSQTPPGTPSEATPSPPENDPADYLAELMLTPVQVQYLENLQNTAKSVESATDYTQLENVIEKILDVATRLDPIEVEKAPSLDKTTTSCEEPYEEPNYEEELKKEEQELKRKGMVKLGNFIPRMYLDGRLHGKGDAIYKRHCAICLQTQNYPNAVYYKKFPNSVLKPGETYTHTVVYKFWIQEGNPSKWIKRNFKPCYEEILNR